LLLFGALNLVCWGIFPNYFWQLERLSHNVVFEPYCSLFLMSRAAVCVCQLLIPVENNVLEYAGPISGPEEAEFILKRTKGVHGFYGASSMERLPVEQAITSTVKQYKSISIH
jgi:hypothetical protein